jgi:hypothetical protein
MDQGKIATPKPIGKPGNEPAFNIRLVSGTSYRNVPPVTPEEELRFPFVFYGKFRQPAFMEITWIAIHGNALEEITIRGDSIDTLQAFAAHNQLPSHPRLLLLRISDNDGKVIKSLSPGKDWQDGPAERTI